MRRDLASTIVLIAALIALAGLALADPTGSDILFNESETKSPASAEYLNTSGGTFATLRLMAESQNLKWKAYAGNVSGVLTLDDSGDYTIFQWALQDYDGRVYASRNDSITWSNIDCATILQVNAEQTALNHSLTAEDNINNTFSLNYHKEFFVGTKQILQDSCKSLFTWANDTVQSSPTRDSPFQEVLLSDNSNLIYTTFVENDVQGFNYNDYDFQMIVPERGVGGYESTRYYFYLELE